MSKRGRNPQPPLTPAERRLAELLGRIAYRRLRERQKLPPRPIAN